jgi:hypothetical protein
MPATPPEVALSLSALVLQPAAHSPLTAAQRRFNDLLARIELLTAQLQTLSAWSDRHRYAHIHSLRASQQSNQQHLKSLLFCLHDKCQTADLSAQQQRMAQRKLRSLLAQLAATADPADSADPRVRALADLYVSEEEAQEEAQALAEAAQRMRERMEQALGQPIEKPSQYQTPDEMLAAGMRQWQRQQQADDARKAAKRAARKAHKKSVAAESGEVPVAVLREADAKSALRTLFRQLASALHPDREPDEAARLRKTAWMSEVNAAYEKNDLITLMRWQIQLVQLSPTQAQAQAQAQALAEHPSDKPGAQSADPQADTRAGVSGTPLSDDKLLALAVLLKEQVRALEDDLDQLQHRLSRELGVPVRAGDDEAQLTQALQRLQADQRQSAEHLEADWRRIQNDAELKRWLKEQWQLAKEAVQQASVD